MFKAFGYLDYPTQEKIDELRGFVSINSVDVYPNKYWNIYITGFSRETDSEEYRIEKQNWYKKQFEHLGLKHFYIIEYYSKEEVK